MAQNTLQNSTEKTAEDHASEKSLLAPEFQIVVLTWISFFLLLAVLKKFAWKPILKALDDRENSIRTAVEEAAKTREEYLKIGDKRKQILTEADHQAKEIMNQSRDAAMKNAKLIEERTKQEAQIILENAQREIEAEQEKAAAFLKEKSANTAVELAEKILRDSLNADKQTKVNNALIDEI